MIIYCVTIFFTLFAKIRTIDDMNVHSNNREGEIEEERIVAIKSVENSKTDLYSSIDVDEKYFLAEKQ